MDASGLFLLGLVATLLVTGVVAGYLRLPLRKLLADQNGGPRAEFWAAYFNVVVVLVPLVFAMLSQPEPGARTPAALALGQQIRWGLLGLVLALLIAGRILRRKTQRPPAAAITAPAPTPSVPHGTAK